MDNPRELNGILMLAAVLTLCVACGPLKPEVHTVIMHDTIYTDRVVSDTIVVSKEQDTIFMEKERLRVRVVRVNDTLMIEGECAADTIYRTTTIEVPIKVVESRWPWWAKPLMWLLVILLGVLGIRKVFGI
jgi:hypothetical protein